MARGLQLGSVNSVIARAAWHGAGGRERGEGKAMQAGGYSPSLLEAESKQ